MAMNESSHNQPAVQWQNRPGMLSEKIREVLRLKHYSLRTEDAYLGWVRRFIRFHHGRNPQGMGAAEVREFLSHLAVAEHVAASTQKPVYFAGARSAPMARSSRARAAA